MGESEGIGTVGIAHPPCSIGPHKPKILDSMGNTTSLDRRARQDPSILGGEVKTTLSSFGCSILDSLGLICAEGRVSEHWQ